MGIRHILSRASLPRALVEAGIFEIIGLLLIIVALGYLSNYEQSVFFLGMLTLLVFALRLRLPGGHWRQQVTVELLNAGVISSVLVGLLATFIMLVSPVNILNVFNSLSSLAIALLFGLVLLVGHAGLFLAVRGGMRFWVRWNRMRQTYLIWSLTHSQLVLYVLAFALMGGVLLLIVFSTSVTDIVRFRSLPQILELFISTIVPLATVSIAFMAGLLLVSLPPTILFAYIVARRITQRLAALAETTSALRAGDYQARVPVRGADEVARLQTDFNAMAADLEQAMQELKAERDRVAGLLHAQRQLVASVSHELRTPVATVRGYLDSTLTHWNGQPPITLHHDLQVMEREMVRLQRLISDLFTLSQAEVSSLTLRREQTDIAELVRRSADALGPMAWQTGRVEVVADVPADVPPVLGDSGRLEQVLHNLVHNGVRHTPPGGIVALSAEAQNGCVLIHVRDTGEGIAAEDLPHIWERFYRAGGTRERDSSGAGLGLALVKELTAAMGGSVAVESTTGAGSCFTVRLPRAGGGKG